MAVPAQRSVSIEIRAPLWREDLPGLVERTCALLEDRPCEVLRCEVGALAPDAVAVDALARLALAARRRSCSVRLGGVSPQLRTLIGFAGLDEVLLASEPPPSLPPAQTPARYRPPGPAAP
jgi:ABC-type transporter Mla MlaB component